MTFISYAQNFEDVMLWRALKHVKQGFYIDIGAWLPDVDSVTRAFYERGWHGINVEPNPEINLQLCERRPLDTNLQVAVGSSPGVVEMNFLSCTGLSTLDDKISQKHRYAGIEIERQQVKVTTLASILKEHVLENQDVHFLKVDVEGFEGAVLGGNDWDRFRPWIVVVEATLPMSHKDDVRVESHEDWEPILLAAHYVLAYADGLNRFYVAQEHAELLSAFKYPPNVFDGYVLNAQKSAEIRAVNAEARAAEAEARAAELLHGFLNSSSWRITAPLRWGTSILRSGYKLSRRIAGRMLRFTLLQIRKVIVRSPLLKGVMKRMLRSLPVVDKVVARFLSRETHASFVYEARRFEELRSVQLMQRIDEIPANSPSIIFLGASNDGK